MVSTTLICHYAVLIVYQATAQNAFSTPTNKDDPYIYQVGFGNSFASEAVYASFAT